MMSLLDTASPSRIGRVGAWCFSHRRLVFAAWLFGLIAITALGRTVGSQFTDNLNGGHSQAEQARTLLQRQFPAYAGDAAQVVFRAPGGLRDPSAQGAVQATLGRLRHLPRVTRVQGPFDAGSVGQVSADGTIAYATVRYDSVAGDLPKPALRELADTTRAASRPDLEVIAGGAPIAEIEKPKFGAAEGAGILAAAIILLFAFGSVIAMGLPILTALFGLAAAFGALDLVSHGLTVPTFGPELAALLGIGVGIDYALFIVSRYRSHLQDGRAPLGAVSDALATSGRAVLFAGSTVVISLLGLLLVGLPYITGAAIGASVAVLLVMAAAVTLLPATLGALGPRIDRLKIRVPRRDRHGCGNHDLRLRGVRPERPAAVEDLRSRHGNRSSRGRHAGPRAARASRHASARHSRVVAAPLARPRPPAHRRRAGRATRADIGRSLRRTGTVTRRTEHGLPTTKADFHDGLRIPSPAPYRCAAGGPRCPVAARARQAASSKRY